jgi:hypothetical protein
MSRSKNLAPFGLALAMGLAACGTPGRGHEHRLPHLAGAVPSEALLAGSDAVSLDKS